MEETMMRKRKEKTKKGNLISKTWERCKSFGGGSSSRAKSLSLKSRSWPRMEVPTASPEVEKRAGKKAGRVAPDGCFTVYVGPEKQRFVVKTEYANHPLFKMLLEEAESEFGYDSQGPLLLPCAVDLFCKVLTEMDDSDGALKLRRGCGFTKRHGSYHLLSPSRMLSINHF